MSNKIIAILKDIDESEVSYHKISRFQYQWHELSYTEPKMSDSDYEALKEDIQLLGKVHNPVLIYENKILDGRHRQKACEELDFLMPIKKLTKEYNISDLREVVRSIHMARNKTQNQKIIQAYRFKQTVSNVTWEDAAQRHGVKVLAIKRINTLYNLLRDNNHEKDFYEIMRLFEYGIVLNEKKFNWLNKNTSSFSGAIKQFKDYLDNLQSKIKNKNIDTTEINPETGETLKKDVNPFIEEYNDENAQLKKEIERLKKENEQLKSQLEEKNMTKLVDKIKNI